MKNISTKKSIIVAILAVAFCACAVFGVLFCKTAYSWLHAEKNVQPEAIVVDMPAVTATKFTTVLPNTGTYLYRIGNQNTVSLGTLFQADSNDVTSSKVTVSVTALEPKSSIANSDGSGQCTYTTDAADWTQSTLKFSGEGPVCVKIREGNGEECALNLEVINGYNVINYNQLIKNSTCVLLNNIEISSGESYSLKDASLYGNGFTFDITDGTHAANTQGVITLNNASIDNVKIVGAVYTTYADLFSKEYYNSAVAATGGNCVIKNSFISGCHSAVRVATANLTVDNTVLYSGRLSNLEITSGNVTLCDVTTVNQPVTSGGKTVMGFGIFIYDYADNVTLKIEGNLTQYNWAKKSDKDYLPSSGSMSIGVNFAFDSDECAQFRQTYNNENYVNFGILNLSKNVATTAVSGQSSDYAFASQSSGAWVCTVKADSATADNMFANGLPNYNETAYESIKQGAVQPTFNWNYPSEYNTTSGNIVLSFEAGKSTLLDPNFLTATKYGDSLAVGVEMDGTDYTGKSITFSEATAGTYTHVLTYTLTDPYNYNADVTTYDQTYAFEISVQVIVTEPEQKNAEFKYTDGSGTKTVTISGKTYVMPDVSGTSSTIASTTVGGQTVYMPVVEAQYKNNSTDFNAYSPIFTAINITDYDAKGNGTTYNTSTKSLPSGLSYVGNISTIVLASSATKYTDPTTYSNYGLCYYGVKGADINESKQTATYCYTDNAGNTIYYCIQYHFSAHKCPTTCFASGTLITLADGTQKAIENVTRDDRIMAWDFTTGQYTASSIAILVDHGNAEYQVSNLTFSDGTVLRIIGDHGVFDYDLNQYVYLSDGNCTEYIGHRFVQYQNNDSYSVVTLESAIVTLEETNAYSITSAGTMNAFAGGMLTVAPPEDFYNWIPMGDKLQYDMEQLDADIKWYGLYTYEDFAAYVTYEQFVAWNGAYLRIPVEKGCFTFDYIIELIELYKQWMP